MTDKNILLAKELTMEYVKQNNMLTCDENEIESQISKIAKVSQTIYDSIQNIFRNFYKVIGFLSSIFFNMELNRQRTFDCDILSL